MTANPLGRAGQPADIAGAVAFLCSDDAVVHHRPHARRQRRRRVLSAPTAAASRGDRRENGTEAGADRAPARLARRTSPRRIDGLPRRGRPRDAARSAVIDAVGPAPVRASRLSAARRDDAPAASSAQPATTARPGSLRGVRRVRGSPDSPRSRTEFGKGGARRTRRAGKIPAVLYGHGTDPRHLSLPAREFSHALKGGANTVLTLQFAERRRAGAAEVGRPAPAARLRRARRPAAGPPRREGHRRHPGRRHRRGRLRHAGAHRR